MLLLTPVIFFIARRLETSAVPFLISQVIASNIGGTATLIGDPPNSEEETVPRCASPVDRADRPERVNGALPVLLDIDGIAVDVPHELVLDLENATRAAPRPDDRAGDARNFGRGRDRAVECPVRIRDVFERYSSIRGIPLGLQRKVGTPTFGRPSADGRD